MRPSPPTSTSPRAALIAALAVGALGGAPGLARAQSAKAAAETAFHKARDLMTAGDPTSACPIFEQSQKLDPQLGTQYNLALCYEQVGKLTSAWINFSEVAAKDARGRRKDDAARRAAALEPRLTRVVLTIAAPVPGETVHLGEIDATVLEGSRAPVDAGEYTVTASAPGHDDWRAPIDVRGEGRVITIDVPALRPSAAPPHRPPPPAVAHAAAPGRGRRLAGAVIGAAGLAAAGVGLYFGKRAFDGEHRAESLCGAAPPCAMPDAAQSAVDGARSDANVANVLVGVGAAALVGGIVLYVTAPHGDAAGEGLAPPADDAGVALAPLVAPGGAGLAVTGRF